MPRPRRDRVPYPESPKPSLKDLYAQTMRQFSDKSKDGEPSPRAKKEQVIQRTFGDVSSALQARSFSLSESQSDMLRLKLARYFQKEESLNPATLADAICETPELLNKTEGSLRAALDCHQQETARKITELMRKRKESGINVTEALFTTSSNKYYLARLLNNEHLEEESVELDHCIGTVSAYKDALKKGTREFFSLRGISDHAPVVTIEYDPQGGIVYQIKTTKDRRIQSSDPFFLDVLDALGQLNRSLAGSQREKKSAIRAVCDLEDIHVASGHAITQRGEIPLASLDATEDYIFKIPRVAREDVSKKAFATLLKIIKEIECEPSAIAYFPEEIDEHTRVYFGPITYPDFFKNLLKTVEHVYTSFPNDEIRRMSIDSSSDVFEELEKLMEQKKIEYHTPYFNIQNLFSNRSERLHEGSVKKMNIARVKLEDLGFWRPVRKKEFYDKAKEVGLSFFSLEAILLCAHNITPLKFPDDSSIFFGMEHPEGHSICVEFNKEHVFLEERDRDSEEVTVLPGYSFLFLY